MAILTGRYGQVKWDQAGVTAVPIISLNAWTGDFKTEFEDVTCFQDTNRVFVPGLRSAEGSLSGFWNSQELALFKAAEATTPGLLELVPNSTEPTYAWSGLAYLDASIDASLQAPKITGNWKAAGAFAMKPVVAATGATAGTPGTFTPVGAAAPANLAAMTGKTANPATNWVTGQYMLLGDASKCNWNGTAWVAGIHA
ncbi:MAG TPA: hypothetical protein VE200_13885 [Xanthobacteraceae bacterium]|nr:hypothetical protein [Xanthobacteraceae bacterium]